ncbi:hypothetical protein [Streptomyces sp. NPDC047976]|uniref:hypothetical protein n=1 Tax=Streptomyces sp. NPDC047976 TaxID=3155746 RepID=UPI003445141F
MPADPSPPNAEVTAVGDRIEFRIKGTEERCEVEVLRVTEYLLKRHGFADIQADVVPNPDSGALGTLLVTSRAA